MTMAANVAHHCMFPGGEDESRQGFIAHSDVHDSSGVVPVASRPRLPTSSVGRDFAECVASRLEELCRIEQDRQPHSSWRCASTRARVGATPDGGGDLGAKGGQGRGTAWVGEAARMRVGEFAGSHSPTLTRASSLSSEEETWQDDSGFVICRGRLTQSNSDQSSCVSNDSISPRTPSEEFELTNGQDLQGVQERDRPSRTRTHIHTHTHTQTHTHATHHGAAAPAAYLNRTSFRSSGNNIAHGRCRPIAPRVRNDPHILPLSDHGEPALQKKRGMTLDRVPDLGWRT